MGEVQAFCRRCRRQIGQQEFEQGTALRMLGRIYCMACLEKRIHNCGSCAKEIQAGDYEAGRAVVLHSRRYCEACAVHVVRRSSSTTSRRLKVPRSVPLPVEAAEAIPETPAEAELRRARRFIPPRDCVLMVREGGLGGLLGGNRVRLWMDVSEGGGRALLSGTYEFDGDLEGEIRYAPRKLVLPFTGSIRHVKASTLNADCQLIGFSFVDPEEGLRVFLRDLTTRLAELAPPRMREHEPPASARPA